MNYNEISEHILVELEYSLEELENLENREQLERQGVDVQNDIERYSSLIDCFKIIVQKAEAFNEIRHIMDYHYPAKEDRQGVRGYQHPKVALKNIGDIIEEYESGERNER